MRAYLIFPILAGLVIQACFILVEHKKRYVPAVILKGSASFFFVLIGLLAFLPRTSDSLCKNVFIGLALGMLGDVLLNLRFVFEKNGQKIFLAGIAAFLAGHILYLAALIPHAVRLWLCVAVGVVLAAALLAYIFATMEVKTSFKAFGVLYLGAVIVMTVIAIGIAIAKPQASSLLYAVGAVLFTASDIVLIFNTFSGKETKFGLRITNLSLYYVGQLLIALSLHLLPL